MDLLNETIVSTKEKRKRKHQVTKVSAPRYTHESSFTLVRTQEQTRMIFFLFIVNPLFPYHGQNEGKKEFHNAQS